MLAALPQSGVDAAILLGKPHGLLGFDDLSELVPLLFRKKANALVVLVGRGLLENSSKSTSVPHNYEYYLNHPHSVQT